MGIKISSRMRCAPSSRTKHVPSEHKVPEKTSEQLDKTFYVGEYEKLYGHSELVNVPECSEYIEVDDEALQAFHSIETRAYELRDNTDNRQNKLENYTIQRRFQPTSNKRMG